MSLFFFVGFTCSLFIFTTLFSNNLFPLLALEMLIVFCIFLYFINFLGFFVDCSFFCNLVFLTFMVVDSVAGIVLLICSCRSSTQVSFFLS